MKIVESFADRLEQSFSSQVAVLLIVSVLFWSLGVPTFLNSANAAYMSGVTDTLSDSNNGTTAVHSIGFTTSTSTKAGETIQIVLDPPAASFTEYFSSATTTDITTTGFTHVSDVGACPGSGSSAYI